jgi:ABC-type nitrate/sulfonate/bicarbonate transport system substrate-binding protein
MSTLHPVPITLALDWTPNTIHTGLFAALSKGYYLEEGISLTILPPSPTYSTTPAKLLEQKQVDLAICPSESCIAYAESGKMHLQAIYAILKSDASAIVSTKFNHISQLESGVYGSYNARYEDAIVKSMISHDGGKGDTMSVHRDAGKLDLFNQLKDGKIDATWVFLPWEGVEAEQQGVKLNVFKTAEYGVPYGYSPVIARNGNRGLSDEVVDRFIKATKKGYEYALQTSNLDQVVGILEKECQPKRDAEFLRKSQKGINPYYLGEGTQAELGEMTEEGWKVWVEWLEGKGLVEKGKVDIGKLYYTS